ncbi:GNAT family N-acetyltransferase [Marinilactibacillus sp. Marseille-P9653]|uniref:GNAT family N-acetyltransferase n=1 Tax=Marinilactibacillus sp. Marseille-P9653 TaxID=2866583 RepID=UPI001CE4B100|nr:GNAT family protein [Marinilactibacillus sp. Marseille-P9653]
MTDDLETLAEFMDGSYYSAKDQNQKLMGFLCFGKNAQVPGGVKAEAYSNKQLTDLGIGMNPKFTGRVLEEAFIQEAIEFGREQLQIRGYRLSVAEFNLRAIKVYERVGFEKKQVFENREAKNKTNFVLMEKSNNF